MAADLLNERLPPDWSYGVTGDGRVFFIRWGRIYSMMDSFSSSRRPLARVWRWNLTRIPVIFVVLAFPVSDTERHLGCIQSQDVPFRRDTRLHPVSATPFCLVPSSSVDCSVSYEISVFNMDISPVYWQLSLTTKGQNSCITIALTWQLRCHCIIITTDIWIPFLNNLKPFLNVIWHRAKTSDFAPYMMRFLKSCVVKQKTKSSDLKKRIWGTD